MKGFASDNYSGIHTEILEAVIRANNAHEISYGADNFSLKTNQLFKDLFGDAEVLYAFNGTGANVIAIKCSVRSFEAVVCSEYAHIHVDECGAPVQQTGCSLIPLQSINGKLTPEIIRPVLKARGNIHHNQPKLISISQTTERGTVYSLQELKNLCNFAHANNMYVHLDGARISNAVASLNCTLKEATVDCGVDIMSFGGTKNGLLIGEAVLIFNNELKSNAAFFQKQTAQLFSKNRFIAAQFEALLTNNLWKRIATHANNMAALLAEKIREIPEVQITRPVDANAVFVIIPEKAIALMQESYPFYIWDDVTLELRWMSSFDTTEDDVLNFVALLKHTIDQVRT